jgi:hypothetical protein
MNPADRAGLEGQPVGPDVDQRHLIDLQQPTMESLGEGHDNCAVLPLDLEHDPDAQAAARFYAARVVHRRPYLARDIIATVGSELRPGERYVEVPE